MAKKPKRKSKAGALSLVLLALLALPFIAGALIREPEAVRKPAPVVKVQCIRCEREHPQWRDDGMCAPCFLDITNGTNYVNPGDER